MNTKYVGIILAAIMLVSMLLGPLLGSVSNQDNNIGDGTTKAPGFETIPGTKMKHELNSLEDGLALTAEEMTVVSYVDYSRIYGTPLQIIAPNISNVYSIYNSMIGKRYSAYNETAGTGFEAHVIYPEVISFPYMLASQSYNGYYLLSRNEQVYNVIGSPVLLGPRSSLEQVIDVKSGNLDSTRRFDRILPYIDAGAEYQVLAAGGGVAELYYMDLKHTGTNYSKTLIFVEPRKSLLENITAHSASSASKGLNYNVTSYEGKNVTKVVISGSEENLYGLILEDVY